MEFFKKCFNAQLKIQQKLHRNRYMLNKSYDIMWFVMIFAMLMFCIFKSEFLSDLVALISLTFLLIIAMQYFNKITTSLRCFLLGGSIIEIILSFTLYNTIEENFRFGKNDVQPIVDYILFIAVLTVTWSIISCIVNNKVATLANLILSTIIGLILYVKDAVFSVMPDNMFINMGSADIYEKFGYSTEQVAEAVITIIFLPFLISNIVATLVCAVKGYWIDKYNKGIDITEENIKDDHCTKQC